MNEPNVNPIQQPSENVSALHIHKEKPQKTAQDWVRDMRMSAAVNKATTGVETDQVTPDLLLATSKRLLGISKREQEPDPKDSLAFQRFYGPEMLFSEHILRDNGKLGRNILWKATNRGNLNFMPVGALEKHISSVFYDSKLAQMMDGSSPLETIDSAYKTTRLGEGGIGSLESAPDEMRTVQPSYFGYIDPIRCYAEDTELMTEEGWKKVQDITGDDKLACLINGRLEYHKPTALSVYDYDGLMYGYDDGHIAYLVTPNHRMYTRCADPKRNGEPCGYNTRSAEDIHGTRRMVNTGMHLPILRNEDETVFHLPPVTADLKHEQVHGMPPQGASLKNVDAIDIVDFAEYMGWYLSEGSCAVDINKGYYRADISQHSGQNPENYQRIKDLIERLPFNATCKPVESGSKYLSIARKQLVRYLQQFGHCDDKFIPEWIFNAPLKARLAFREAMLLGDGRAQRHLCTKSRRLAEDFARLQFELGESVKILHEKEDRYPNHPGIWVVYWHSRREAGLQKRIKRKHTTPYFTQKYTHKVYCPTVPGGLVYCRKSESYQGFWCHQSPESIRVGLDVYMTKNVMKGTDGKLYQKFIDAKTGKEVLLDSETAANSVIAAPEMMEAKTKSVYALGGPTGIHIVPRSSVQYYLPRADEAYSAASNLIPMLSGVKNMRVQMGCLHPDTNVIVIDKHGLITTKQAKVLNSGSLPGSTKEGTSQVYPIRTTVSKFPPKKNWFRKVILRSGRSIITSADHRWSILRKGEYMLVEAKDLKQGDIALRTTFKDVPSRRTFINHMLVNKQLAKALGILARSLDEPDNKKMRVTMQEEDYPAFMEAMARIGYKDGFNTYFVDHAFYVGIRDDGLRDLLRNLFGRDDRTRHVPTEIMSAGAAVVGAFIDGYTSDLTKMGQDSNDDIWVLDIPNLRMRDELAFLFARLETDTLYRDRVAGKAMDLALKLVPMEPDYSDMITDEIKLVQSGINAPIMIDIDVDDNLYATANGVVTHNSKYPLQAVSIASREAPMVRGLDEITGKDMPTLIGKYLGARFADRDGVVTAVRKDRIDVQYSDGSKGKVDLYVNFPMNAKGYINNTPVVKAGQAFKKGDVLASSNYTDDKGVAAIGTNLRTGWLSWKGGTYEDAVVISESAAKKLTSTTMYKTSVDLDKTITLGKKNYITWKPAEFTKEQMENLDDNGVVKPGTLLHKEDPMILAVRTTEPSPGTMGKRILTDLSERWEHDYPGVVTDVVKTRNGIKVYATVTAPAEVGDKLSNSYGAKGVISCFDSETYIFTKRGFVKFEDLMLDDEVAAIDEQGYAAFERPTAITHIAYDGPLYKFEGKKLNFAVTPNHRMLCASEHKFDPANPCYDFVRADEMFGHKVIIPINAKFKENRRLHSTITLPAYTPTGYGPYPTDLKNTFDLLDYAKLLGIFLAEGDTKRKQSYFVITQADMESDPGSHERCLLIEQLLNRMGVAWRRSGIKFIIKNKPLWQEFHKFGKSHEKYIPEEVFTEWPREAQEALLEWHYMGDGDKTGTTHRCATVSLQLALDLQRLHILCGRQCNVSYSDQTYNADGSTHKRKFYRITDYPVTVNHATLGGRNNKDKFVVVNYKGNVHCVQVSTGRIMVCRNGRVMLCGNCIIPDDEMPQNAKGEPLEMLFSPLGLITRTNPAQLYEAQLGKIAKKTGKPITVPAFFKGSMQEYVADQLKQNHLKPDEDLLNPETGLPIKDVLTGYSYIYKLKHLSESKMSARGTSTYDAEQVPAGKGMDGCFPAAQILLTRNGQKRMGEIAGECGIAWIETMSDDKKRRFGRVIDRFKRYVPAADLLSITSTWSYNDDGKYSTRTAEMLPTKNHAIYMYDMTQKHAVDLKPGDKLAGIGLRPTDEQLQILWNLMHKPGVIDNDKLHVFYDPEANKLARFKADALKALGVKRIPKLHEIVVPKYSLYEATLTDADNGDLAKALQALDDAERDYPISSEDQIRISDWIPWKVIPDYATSVKRLAKKQQKLAAVKSIGLEPYPGLMPLIVAGIEPLKRKAALQVFDLTVENIHRYVLKGGFLVSNSKRFGTLEQSALIGHGAEEIIRDAKWIRGQSNSDFWRSLRTGDIPTMPGEPLVHKKFFAHLTGAGINVRKTPQGVSIFALTNKDVSELAGPRELRSRDTYEARTFRPIDGGLFGQDIFGINGDKWAYIQLDEPVPNPVMEGPLSLLLNIPEKKFADVAAGKDSINGISGGPAMKKALEKMNLQAESARALDAYKTSSMSNKDKALKRYVAIERMRRQGVNPADYMLDKIPVLPPIYRPISTHNGLTMVADSNYLYAQLLDAKNDMEEAKGLPKELQQTARENLYNKWKELTGLYAPQDVKLQSKHVQGLLKWALGDSPKFSALQRKVLSATVDTVGRGAIMPDSRLRLNELGIPAEMAFNIFAPMVERSLVKRGYTPVQAMKMVKEHNDQARDVLNEVMKDHPVLMNRAPTLHKLSIMAFNPRLVDGHAIHVNPSIVVPFGADFDGDTVNIHAPVSDKARRQAYDKMFPERNLISMRSRGIVYKPEKEYQQGLYIGTRMKQGADVRTRYFNTLEEAKQAYRQGLIDIDDPIEIRNK